ncbi:MAG TPA: M24 family metallopeptidase [Beijerinckiaceae bacterium]|nr:M24 family metallopeptidase [Beijerinckiaceae bacterium]
MAARRVDVLVAQSERDFSGGYCRWFTDAPAANPKSVLFYADGGLTLIDHGAAGRRRDLRAAPDPEHPGVTEVITTSSFQNADYTQGYDADCAADVLVKRAVKRIGLIAPRRMPHGFVSRLMETLGEAAEFSDETDFIDALKAVKSPSEIEAIRATAQMQDAAFAEVLSKIRPGMRDFEITALARYHGEMMGSEQGLFLGVSATLGTPAGLAPKHVQGRAFERGDYMTLLIENNGPGGYYAELARLIVFGKASAELEEAFACTKQAQAKTAANLRPGASPAEICQAHNAFMTACGGPPEARLYAHSQGYDLVERPLVRDDETMALQANMNMAVHPSWGSSTLFALVCDNYLVRDNGPAERLHRTEQKIFEL